MKLRYVLLGALVGFFSTVAGGCTAIYNHSATQCLNEDDCLSRGPGFENTTCSVDRVCVPIPPDARLCSTNQNCIDRSGGAPARCRPSDHKCVTITNDDCPKVIADKTDILDDNAIYIGLIVPQDINGAQSEDAVDLARKEIKQAFGGGVLPATPGGPKRPLVFIDCNNELGAATRAAQFLVNDVQVPALTGLFVSSDVLSVAQQVTIPGNVLATSPNATAAAISGLAANDHGLVFRLAPPDTVVMTVVSPFIQQYLDPKARALDMLGPTDPLRVYLMHSGDGSGIFSAQTLEKILVVNNMSVADNLTANNMKIKNLGDPNDKVNNPNPQLNYSNAVSEILTFQPHLVIYVGGPESYPFLLPQIEKLWPMGTPRPLYFASTAWQALVVPTIAANQNLRQRVFGFQPLAEGYDQNAFNAWVTSLKSTFGELQNQNIAPAYSPNVYDLTYLYAYAILATGADDITGPNLVKGMQRLTVNGTDSVAFGPQDLPRAASLLASGKNFDYSGVNGLIHFTPQGDREAIAATWCVLADPMTGLANKTTPTGFTYDPIKQQVQGSVTNCP